MLDFLADSLDQFLIKYVGLDSSEMRDRKTSFLWKYRDFKALESGKFFFKAS